jgi:hypothetical protein
MEHRVKKLIGGSKSLASWPPVMRTVMAQSNSSSTRTLTAEWLRRKWSSRYGWMVELEMMPLAHAFVDRIRSRVPYALQSLEALRRSFSFTARSRPIEDLRRNGGSHSRARAGAFQAACRRPEEPNHRARREKAISERL